MTTPTNKDHPAIDAYIAKLAHIRTMLKRLASAADDHFGDDPDRIHWGHVADLARIEQGLETICDQVFREGEYAPDNN